jgi:hypothetical protein
MATRARTSLLHEVIVKTGAIQRVTDDTGWWPWTTTQTVIYFVLPAVLLLLIAFMLKRRYQDHLAERQEARSGRPDQEDELERSGEK